MGSAIACVRNLLGLELLLLVLVTHAHTQQVLPGVGTAQDLTVSSRALEATTTTEQKDNSQQHPPAVADKTDGSAGKSVVVNWKLACKQLCSAGLGGPSCGSTWLRSTTTNTHKLPVDKDTLTGVCPSLCANGLGISKCACNSFQPKAQMNPNLICQAFCSTANVQVTGCSRCDGTESENGTLGALETIETTTPNWDELCSMFCKMGDGGTLCNCDLPPFF
uniref:Uncharacterized protein n=1 Tax=Anopheles farauti TaxID=69004 RepID=A0A182Q1C9_9DIPT